MILTEGNHVAEFLLEDENGAGAYSREQVTVAQGTAEMRAGTLMGKVAATGKYVPYLNTAVDGSQAVAGIILNTLPEQAAAADHKATLIVRGPATVVASLLIGSDAGALADLAAIVPPIVPR
jgi:hypothetical protein